MQTVTLNNGVDMPILGLGFSKYQIPMSVNKPYMKP
ncbi:diketogulonate reductase-like aldo/keto reductase [Paenibacillus forsythiae]|uniref:Diketogulonate reductase-like aldo/keto reductase n=1 Tax=Paenibacillus forsythiae TaxID=365616 RepID=A0ABU3H5Z9_9BACL|nr:diketogulonate reductase-like aldo/keto reductase [Paenibacillus forsythiae]